MSEEISGMTAAERIAAIKEKCEFYWNEDNVPNAEIHAVLERIHEHAREIDKEMARLAPQPAPGPRCLKCGRLELWGQYFISYQDCKSCSEVNSDLSNIAQFFPAPSPQVDESVSQIIVDLGILLAELEAHQANTGKSLEDDDAALVADIKRRYASVRKHLEVKE